MRSIGFYSFKGGVGRTNLLLNIAYHLADSKGMNVGIIDLDLEAPGLTVLPNLEPSPMIDDRLGNYPNKGVWDFLAAATDAMARKNSRKKVPDIQQIFYETKMAHKAVGSVHLAPAYPHFSDQRLYQISQKDRGASVFKKLLSNWESGQTIGAEVFSYIRRKLNDAEFPVSKLSKSDKKKLDFLLVDLRTGLTELADSAIGNLFTELFLLSGLNTQNTQGMLQAIRAMDEKLKRSRGLKDIEGKIRVTPILSPVPNAEITRVREKIRKVYSDLKDLKQELDQEDSLLQLLLHPDIDDEKGAPKFYTIHYTDYLAVGDGIIIEEFPETLTARELVEISEKLLEDPIAASQKTEEQFRESIQTTEKPEPSPLPPDPCWNWISSFWQEVPDWRWPLSIFTAEDYNDNLLLNRFPDFIDPDVRKKILNGLASGLGADKNGKIKFIHDFKEMEEDRFTTLLQNLTGEQNRLVNADPKYTKTLARRTLTAMREWMDILEIFGARLISGKNMVQLIRKGENPVKEVPFWGMLIMLIGMRSEKHAVNTAAETLFLSPETPLDAGLSALKMLDQETLKYFPLLVESIQNWIGRVLKDDMPLDWYNDLATKLWGKFDFYNEAEEVYQKVINSQLESEKQLAITWSDYGELLQTHFKKHDEAEKAYRKAIKIDPESTDSWNGLANLLHEPLGRFDEAEKAYRKAIELDPKYAVPWSNLGSLLKESLGRYEEAEKAYRKSIELDPKDPNPWDGLANLLARYLGRYEEAEKAYRKAIELDPKYPFPWNGLGNLYMDYLKLSEEAEKAYKKAIELGERYAAFPFWNLLLFYTTRGDKKEIKYHIESIKRYLSNEIDTDKPEQLNFMHAFLCGLTNNKKAARDILLCLEKERLEIHRLVDCWICARMIGDKHLFIDLPIYKKYSIASWELETLFEAAFLCMKHLPESAMKELLKWLKDVHEVFEPQDGSKSLDKERIEFYGKQIGLI